MAESNVSVPDLADINMHDLSHRLGHEVLRSSIRRLQEAPTSAWSNDHDPLRVAPIIGRMMMHLASNPLALLPAQMGLAHDLATIGHRAFLGALGFETESHVETPPGDRRFRHDAWCEHFYFDAARQGYLATVGRIFEALESVGDP